MMKKAYFLFAVLFSTIGIQAQQFKTVEIGIDGLTCSMCTRTTEMNIRKLSFVDSVAMDLANTNGVITFKKGSVVDLYQIAKAVENAGFSVRYLKAEFDLTSQNINSESCFTYGEDQYKYLGKESKTFSGPTKFTLIGKQFMSPKEFKRWASKTKDVCTADKKTLYVTI